MPRGFACVYVGTKNKLDVVYSSTRRRSPGSSTAKPPPSRGGQSHGTSRSSTSSSIASDHHGHDAAGANTDRGHQLVSPVMWSPRQALVDGGHFDTTPVGEDDDDDDDDEDDDNAEDEDEPPAADLEPDGALDAADDTEESDAGATAALAAAAEAFDVFAANPLPDALLFDADMLRLRRHHQPQPEPRNPSFPPSPAKHTKSAWPPTSSVLATPPLPLIPASSSAGLLAADLLPLPAPLWPDAAAAAGVVGGGGMAGVWPVDGLLLDEHPLFHGPVGYLDLLPLQALLLAGAGAGVPSADTDLFGLAA
ncbi:hypothetical protein HK405_002687 [Cladochytrium tenue]|nr:hypothetical protein HK405_002687 [Cladochytrium tenue]